MMAELGDASSMAKESEGASIHASHSVDSAGTDDGDGEGKEPALTVKTKTSSGKSIAQIPVPSDDNRRIAHKYFMDFIDEPFDSPRRSQRGRRVCARTAVDCMYTRVTGRCARQSNVFNL